MKLENEEEQVLKRSQTGGLYLASNLSREVAFDYSDKSSSDEEQNGKSQTRDKLVDSTDQILHKQRLEQRINLYKNKGAVKLCIGCEDAIKFKWPKDVCWAKFTSKTKLVGQQIILVCDSANDRICVFTTQGEHLFSFGENGQFDSPASACCYADGTIVVSDSTNRVQWFDFNGNFQKLIGNQNGGNQSIETQSNANASLPVPNSASNLVQNLQRQTSAEPGQFSAPYGLCYEANSNELYVCDKGNQRVQILDAESGAFKRFLGSSNHSSRLSTVIKFPLKSPNFVHTNGQHVIVSDTNSHCVHVLNIKNSRNQKLMIGGEGTGLSKFKYPRGIALDEFGFIIVADSGNNRIQIFNPDGSFLKVGSRVCFFFNLKFVYQNYLFFLIAFL